MSAARWLVALALGALWLCGWVRGAGGEDARARAAEAVERGELDVARALYEGLLKESGGDWALHYNLACVLALQGERELAVASLEEALSRGFTDFDHLERDAHLRGLRGVQRFEVIRAGRREILDARGEADLEAAVRLLGAGYRTARDEVLRLNYVCAMDEEALATARREIGRVAAWARAAVWAGEEDGAPATHWVTVILPTAEDYVKFVPVEGVGGIYNHDQRMLVAQDIGSSLRHEFMHLLHYRRMASVGQRHAFWLQEGLGSLPEDFVGDTPGVSWRTNILKRLARHGSLVSWRELFAMEKARFSTLRPVAHYAQARGVFLFLSERGVLGEWLLAYERAVGEGAESAERAAFERVFGAAMEETERAYRQWARELREVAVELRRGDASLGVVVSEGAGDGPRVEVVEDASGFRKGNRLWEGDVITGVGGVATPTMQALVGVLSGYGVGDEVEVEVRRGRKRERVRVSLVAR